jgi:gliding motility-associated-like protein
MKKILTATAFMALSIVTFAGPNAADCDCLTDVPKKFTPNGDGQDDAFVPKNNCEAGFYKLTIFGKEDKPIYSSADVKTGWDGKVREELAPAGTYKYIILVSTTTDPANACKLEGSIELVR